MITSTSRILALALLTAVSGAGASEAPRASEAERLDSGLPSCIGYHAQARGSVGYDHLVTVNNGCTRAAQCSVATDVNPDPIRLHVRAGESETVVTFRGSPAREFTARVACALE